MAGRYAHAVDEAKIRAVKSLESVLNNPTNAKIIPLKKSS